MASGQQDACALLWDVFHFLSENLSGEMLSDAADNSRKALLNRLACLFPELPSTYLDMNGKNHCDDEYITSDVSESAKSQSDSAMNSSEKLNISNPLRETAVRNATVELSPALVNISYKEVCAKALKSGPLLRRERLFFLDQYRRCWAGVLDQTLLVYTGERDTKPVFVLNIKGFSAHRVTNFVTKDQKKKDLCFELVCPGQKTYNFIARTTKDMDQWVAAICDASGYEPFQNNQKPHQPMRKLPSLPLEDQQETYDDINVFHDDEEIYHDISDMQPPSLTESTFPSEAIGSGPQENRANSENDEDVYDDVSSVFTVKSTEPHSGLKKAQDQKNTTPPPSISQREPADNTTELYEDDQEIYDDIGPKKTFPMQMNSSGKATSPVKLIDKPFREQIIESVIKLQKSNNSFKVEIPHPVKAESSEELYEAIENPN